MRMTEEVSWLMKVSNSKTVILKSEILDSECHPEPLNEVKRNVEGPLLNTSFDIPPSYSGLLRMTF
jgi:hypothetical protein